jgi:FADH2 O2-dependent halogenase
MYSLRFDDGVTSAGFLLSPRGAASLAGAEPDAMWRTLLARYPTLGDLFGGAAPLFPIRYVPRVQHRLSRATGAGWALLPHAYAFVDPHFSTGIAWGLRGVERLALMFEEAADGARSPDEQSLARYDALLAAEADQVDRLVAGAYDAMASFDLFAAHAMIYFAIVSYGEVQQRFAPDEQWAWSGFLGVGDEVSEPLPAEARRRVGQITRAGTVTGTPDERAAFVRWVADSIAPRNIAGLADPARGSLYPVDLDTLVDRHALLGLDRARLIERLPLLRGLAPSA